MNCTFQGNPNAFDDLVKADLEILFECDKGSGKFTAVCTQDIGVNCSHLPIRTTTTSKSKEASGT